MITNPSLKAYLNWHKQRGFYWVQKRAASKVLKTNIKVLFIEHNNGSLLQHDNLNHNHARELFKKITLAMNLNEDDYEIINSKNFSSDIITRLFPKTFVILGQRAYIELNGQRADDFGKILPFNKYPQLEAMLTYHPDDMLKNLYIKKPTWNHLKKVMMMLN